MICPICKSEIKEDSKFCSKCGKQIPRCPTCNKVINKKMRFCINDGTPLPEEIFVGLSDFQETNYIEPEAPTKNEGEEHSNETADSKSFDTVPVLMPKLTTTNNKVSQHYCVRCGAPCSDAQVLCLECQKKATPKATEKAISKKRKRILPLLFILLFLGLAGFLGYSMVSGNITLEMFMKNTTNSTVSETDADEKTVIDRSVTDEEETIEGSALPSNITESTETSTEIATQEVESNETESNISGVIEIDPVEYFILNCDKEYFTKEDLTVFDADMCRIARNGIYARLGRKFQDETLSAYFLKYDWYSPTIDPEDFSDNLLNEYQIANRDLIVEYEQEQGYR